jgi:two-component system chemotaxis sensor kinase CheA
MDMNQYLDVFVEESKEHLQSLNTSLLELEKDPNNITVLNEIFRVAHTLKGMAGTMGFSHMTNLTHDMENVLDALRSKRIKADMAVVDILFKCLDALEGYVNEVISTGGEGEQEYKEIIKSLTDILDKSPNTKTQIKKKKAKKENRGQ